MSTTLSKAPRTAALVEPDGGGLGAPALRVTGDVPRERTFTLADLRLLPARWLGPTEIVCFSGRPVELAESYRGVALLDLLALTGLPEVPRPTLKECMVVARGGDGYRALFSWTELYNTATGDGVLVVYEKNSQPLDARSGPVALLSSADRRLGPRHLRRLCEIKVLRLPA